MYVVFLVGAASLPAASPVNGTGLDTAAALLVNTPMLATHDAATGYMGTTDVRSPWMRTQIGGFPMQASCGARGFDLRLGKYDDEIRMHHGGFYMWGQTVAGTMAEMVEWANARPSELLVMMPSHCEICSGVEKPLYKGTGCQAVSCADAAFVQPFHANQIEVVSDCSELKSLTRDEAMRRGKLDGGGHIIAILDTCVDQNYDETIGWGCVLVGCDKSHEASFAKLFNYFDGLLHSGAKDSIWWLQAIWQQAESLKKDPFQSIYSYTTKSGINQRVLERYQSGQMDGAAIVLSNYICDAGPDLATAFGHVVTSEDRSSCQRECAQLKVALADTLEYNATSAAIMPMSARL